MFERHSLIGLVHTLAALAMGFMAPLHAAQIPVTDFPALQAAAKAAQPGDTIILEPGTYRVVDKIRAYTRGRAEAPIVIRAREFGTAVLEVDVLEAFFLNGAHWHIESLVIRGVCLDDSDCEHAFHVFGGADDVVIRGNHVVDFNAHLKGNGSVIDGALQFPDRVVVEGNIFRNGAPRRTSNPVTPIDVVGGENWMVRDNLVEDFAKGAGNRTSYGIYLKGNSRGGIIERNLVRCVSTHTGGARIGISLGGGGTGKRYCTDQDCSHEHRQGLIRNNIVLDCPREHGIYLNKASETQIYHNTLIGTRGVLVRFDTSSARLMGNLIAGNIETLSGGTILEVGNLVNLEYRVARWVSTNMREKGEGPVPRRGTPPYNPKAAFRVVEDDYCGQPRKDPRPDIGAVERRSAGWCRKFDGVELP